MTDTRTTGSFITSKAPMAADSSAWQNGGEATIGVAAETRGDQYNLPTAPIAAMQAGEPPQQQPDVRAAQSNEFGQSHLPSGGPIAHRSFGFNLVRGGVRVRGNKSRSVTVGAAADGRSVNAHQARRIARTATDFILSQKQSPELQQRVQKAAETPYYERKYKGVHLERGRFRASLWRMGDRFHTKAVPDPETAALVYDHLTRNLKGNADMEFNFPLHPGEPAYNAPPPPAKRVDRVETVIPANVTSVTSAEDLHPMLRFRGIQPYYGKWRARFVHPVHGRAIYSNIRSTAEEAARAFDALVREHHAWRSVAVNFPHNSRERAFDAVRLLRQQGGPPQGDPSSTAASTATSPKVAANDSASGSPLAAPVAADERKEAPAADGKRPRRRRSSRRPRKPARTAYEGMISYTDAMVPSDNTGDEEEEDDDEEENVEEEDQDQDQDQEEGNGTNQEANGRPTTAGDGHTPMGNSPAPVDEAYDSDEDIFLPRRYTGWTVDDGYGDAMSRAPPVARHRLEQAYTAQRIERELVETDVRKQRAIADAFGDTVEDDDDEEEAELTRVYRHIPGPFQSPSTEHLCRARLHFERATSVTPSHVRQLIAGRFFASRLGNRDQHYSVCAACGSSGDVVMCDRCPCVWHVNCAPDLAQEGVPEGEWVCPLCQLYPGHTPPGQSPGGNLRPSTTTIRQGSGPESRRGPPHMRHRSTSIAGDEGSSSPKLRAASRATIVLAPTTFAAAHPAPMAPTPFTAGSRATLGRAHGETLLPRPIPSTGVDLLRRRVASRIVEYLEQRHGVVTNPSILQLWGLSENDVIFRNTIVRCPPPAAMIDHPACATLEAVKELGLSALLESPTKPTLDIVGESCGTEFGKALAKDAVEVACRGWEGLYQCNFPDRIPVYLAAFFRAYTWWHEGHRAIPHYEGGASKSTQAARVLNEAGAGRIGETLVAVMLHAWNFLANAGHEVPSAATQLFGSGLSALQEALSPEACDPLPMPPPAPLFRLEEAAISLLPEDVKEELAGSLSQLVASVTGPWGSLPSFTDPDQRLAPHGANESSGKTFAADWPYSLPSCPRRLRRCGSGGHRVRPIAGAGRTAFPNLPAAPTNIGTEEPMEDEGPFMDIRAPHTRDFLPAVVRVRGMIRDQDEDEVGIAGGAHSSAPDSQGVSWSRFPLAVPPPGVWFDRFGSGTRGNDSEEYHVMRCATMVQAGPFWATICGRESQGKGHCLRTPTWLGTALAGNVATMLASADDACLPEPRAFLPVGDPFMKVFRNPAALDQVAGESAGRRFGGSKHAFHPDRLSQPFASSAASVAHPPPDSKLNVIPEIGTGFVPVGPLPCPLMDVTSSWRTLMERIILAEATDAHGSPPPWQDSARAVLDEFRTTRVAPWKRWIDDAAHASDALIRLLRKRPKSHVNPRYGAERWSPAGVSHQRDVFLSRLARQESLSLPQQEKASQWLHEELSHLDPAAVEKWHQEPGLHLLLAAASTRIETNPVVSTLSWWDASQRDRPRASHAAPTWNARSRPARSPATPRWKGGGWRRYVWLRPVAEAALDLLRDAPGLRGTEPDPLLVDVALDRVLEGSSSDAWDSDDPESRDDEDDDDDEVDAEAEDEGEDAEQTKKKRKRKLEDGEEEVVDIFSLAPSSSPSVSKPKHRVRIRTTDWAWQDWVRGIRDSKSLPRPSAWVDAEEMWLWSGKTPFEEGCSVRARDKADMNPPPPSIQRRYDGGAYVGLESWWANPHRTEDVAAVAAAVQGIPALPPVQTTPTPPATPREATSTETRGTVIPMKRLREMYGSMFDPPPGVAPPPKRPRFVVRRKAGETD